MYENGRFRDLPYLLQSDDVFCSKLRSSCVALQLCSLLISWWLRLFLASSTSIAYAKMMLLVYLRVLTASSSSSICIHSQIMTTYRIYSSQFCVVKIKWFFLFIFRRCIRQRICMHLVVAVIVKDVKRYTKSSMVLIIHAESPYLNVFVCCFYETAAHVFV